MRSVNLLPLDANAPRPKLPYASVVLAATVPVLVAALVYLGYSLEHTKVADRQIVLDTLASQVTALSPKASLTSVTSRVQSERADRLSQVRGVLTTETSFDVVLDQVARVMPGNAWLSSFVATPVAAPATPPTTSATATPPTSTSPSVTISGVTYTPADVSAVIQRLGLVAAFTNVTLTTITAAKIGEKSVTQFTVTASLLGGGS
jgi:Tfp pilus assembly protein PilN